MFNKHSELKICQNLLFPYKITLAVSTKGIYILYVTGGKHKARGLNPALHLVVSSLAPCFYPAAVLSSLPIVKEQLHLYHPKITFGPLKATSRLMWPLVKMSLTPLL